LSADKVISIQKVRIILAIMLALAFLAPTTYTLAQEPASSYAGLMPTKLQRTLDAWGKGPFCAGCHNMRYPLPPEGPLPQPMNAVEATDMEPGLKRLTNDPGADVGAVYSSKEDKIVWATDSVGNWTIWIMNGDGSNKKQLTSNNVISGWPSWSPDSQEIAYWSFNPSSKTSDIWKMKSDGSSKMKLTTDGTYKGSPMWSPRGDRISYTANQTGNMEVYVINIDGGGKKQLTTGHNPGYSLETRTTWNPDGVRLYYQALTFPLPPYTVTTISGDVAFVEIFMVNVDTGKESNLTPKLHENVRSVSSDGEKMACISLRSPNYGLWIMNTDGSNQTRLTWDGAGDRAPRLSPDGKKIAYWSLAYRNQPDIWMINADGTNKTRLTTSPYQDVYPSWSPDGKKVIFESDRAGSFDIWQLSLQQLVTVEVSFEDCPAPGSASKALLTVRSSGDGNRQVQLDRVGLHFDWNNESKYTENRSSLPKTLSGPNDVYQLYVGLSVPKEAKFGYHFYDVRVEYTEMKGGVMGTTRIYEHSAGDLEVGTLARGQCKELYKDLGTELERRHETEINRSISIGKTTSEVVLPLKGYFDYLLRPEAESFVRANNEFDAAESLMRQGDYEAALPHLLTVRTILTEHQPATTAEQSSSLSLILLTSLPLAVVIVVSFLVLRSRIDRGSTRNDG